MEDVTRSAAMEPEFINATDAARLLSVSRWTLYAMAAKGTLPSYSLPGSRALRFRLSDVRAVLQPRGQSTNHE